MRFRGKVALVAIVVVLQTAYAISMPPKNSRKSPTNKYLKNMKTDKKFINPKRQTFKTNGQSMPTYDFPVVDYPSEYIPKFPYDVSTNHNTDLFRLNERPTTKTLENTKLLNDLRKERRKKRKNNYNKIMNESPKETIKTNDPIYITQIGTFPETQYPLTVAETWGPNFWNPLSFNVQDPYYRTDDDIIKNYVQKNIKKDVNPTTTYNTHIKDNLEILNISKLPFEGRKLDTPKSGKIIDISTKINKDEDNKKIGNLTESEVYTVTEENKIKPKITRKIKIITKSRPKLKSSNNGIQQLSNDNSSSCTDCKNSDNLSGIPTTKNENKNNLNVKFADEIIAEGNSTYADLPSINFDTCLINTNNTTQSTNSSSVTCTIDFNLATEKPVQEPEIVLDIYFTDINNNKSLSDKNADDIPVSNELSRILNIPPLEENNTGSITGSIDNTQIHELLTSNNAQILKHNNTELNVNAHALHVELDDLIQFDQSDGITNTSEEETKLSVSPDIVLLDLERAINESKADGTIDRLMPKIKQAILEAIIESAAYIPSSFIYNRYPTEIESAIPTDPNKEYEIIDDKLLRNQKYRLLDEENESNFINTKVCNEDTVDTEPIHKELDLTDLVSDDDCKIRKENYNTFEMILNNNKVSCPTSEIRSSQEDTISLKDEDNNLMERQSLNTSDNANKNEINIAKTQTTSNESALNYYNEMTNINTTNTQFSNKYSIENYTNRTVLKEETDNFIGQTFGDPSSKGNVSPDEIQFEMNGTSPEKNDYNYDDNVSTTTSDFIELKNDNNTLPSVPYNVSETKDPDLNIVPLDSIVANENLNNIPCNDTLEKNISNDINTSFPLEKTTLQLPSCNDDQSKETPDNNIESILTFNQINQENGEIANDILLNKNVNDISQNIAEKNNDENLSHRGEANNNGIINNQALTDSILTTNTVAKIGNIVSFENIRDKEDLRNEKFKESLLVELKPVESYDDDLIFEVDKTNIDSFDDYLGISYTDVTQEPYAEQDLITYTPQPNDDMEQHYSEEQTDKISAENISPEEIHNDDGLKRDKSIILRNDYNNQDNSVNHSKEEELLKKSFEDSQDDISLPTAVDAAISEEKLRNENHQELSSTEQLNNTELLTSPSLIESIKNETTFIDTPEDDIKQKTSHILVNDETVTDKCSNELKCDNPLSILDVDTRSNEDNQETDSSKIKTSDELPNSLIQVSNDNNDYLKEVMHEDNGATISSNENTDELETFLDTFLKYSADTENIIDRILKEIELSSM